MARRVFFSFHHQRDSWRVSQVRNSWVAKKGTANSFLDAADWEAVQRKGEVAVKAWIDRQMLGAGVTVVLIGRQTATRPYVQYEIQQSIRNRKGLLGIYIHRIRDRNGRTTTKGHNPLDDFTVTRDDPWFGWLGVRSKQRISDIFQSFDWEEDDGRANMPDWIEEAARRANR
jgi:hypothetical protein